MYEITIYSIDNCSYCIKAKDLVKANEDVLDYEIVNAKELSQENWVQRLGYKPDTVPQITVNGKLLGGYRELYNFLRLRGMKTSP